MDYIDFVTLGKKKTKLNEFVKWLEVALVRVAKINRGSAHFHA